MGAGLTAAVVPGRGDEAQASVPTAAPTSASARSEVQGRTDATIRGMTKPATSGGPAAMPRIYMRAEWGAAKPRRVAQVLDRAPDHIVVHHTATPNTPDLSLAHAFALSRQVQRYHIRHNKWDDSGQQLTISRGGFVMEGRNQSLATILTRRLVVGAQTLHHNEHTLGIECEGLYMTEAAPPLLWNSLVQVCAWLCTVYGLDPATALVGHRDYNRTSCPGNLLYTQLVTLRQTVALRLSA